MQIINEVLSHCKELDLEERTIKKLKQVYMERSRDKVIAVRSAAATGLCMLQNPIEPDEDILKLVSTNMQYDPVGSIRVIYAERILVHPLTTDSIQSRLRDEDILVRLAILKNLKEHARIQQLPIKLRHEVIYSLQDRNEVVITATEAIFTSNWCVKDSLLVVLSLLDVETTELPGELFLHAIFSYEQRRQNAVFTEQVSVSLTQLTSLTSFYLYCYVRYLFEQQREQEIDCLIPDIPSFCAIVRSASENASQPQVFFALERCLQYLDISDPACKDAVLQLLRQLLVNPKITTEEASALLSALLNLLDDENAFLRYVSTIQMTTSEVMLLIGEIEDSSPSSDDALLSLTKSVFRLLSSKAFSRGDVRSLFDRIVVRNLGSAIPAQRCAAVSSLASAAIFWRDMATQYLGLLMCMASEDDEDPAVKSAAISALVDVTITFGEMEGVSLEEVSSTLARLVFSAGETVQCAACEGVSRLFLFDKLRSVHVLSSLLLLWGNTQGVISSLFDSSTAKRPRLRQILSVFFPSYCNPEQDKNCLFLSEAVIYTIKGVGEAAISDRFPMVAAMSRYFLWGWRAKLRVAR